MLLTLDVGNSHIYGGVFDGEHLEFTFRKSSQDSASSDELGLFFRAVIRENGGDPAQVSQVALCSVVPDLQYSLTNACRKYFRAIPFILQAGVKTGLKIRYRNPVEVGADRIANAIGATTLYPGKNLILVDQGTATTFCVVTRERDYQGGIILPGLRIQMEALESGTAKLPKVEIRAPSEVVGRSTVESIQSGLFFGQLAAMEGLITRIKRESFPHEEVQVIGTGGFSRLFEKSGVFDAIQPDLVLHGLKVAHEMNC